MRKLCLLSRSLRPQFELFFARRKSKKLSEWEREERRELKKMFTYELFTRFEFERECGECRRTKFWQLEKPLTRPFSLSGHTVREKTSTFYPLTADKRSAENFRDHKFALKNCPFALFELEQFTQRNYCSAQAYSARQDRTTHSLPVSLLALPAWQFVLPIKQESWSSITNIVCTIHCTVRFFSLVAIRNEHTTKAWAVSRNKKYKNSSCLKKRKTFVTQRCAQSDETNLSCFLSLFCSLFLSLFIKLECHFASERDIESAREHILACDYCTRFEQCRQNIWKIHANNALNSSISIRATSIARIEKYIKHSIWKKVW